MFIRNAREIGKDIAEYEYRTEGSGANAVIFNCEFTTRIKKYMSAKYFIFFFLYMLTL